MARHEAEREDLMAEATALRERVELAMPDEAAHVVAGFRDDGRFSIYFGDDPVFHFDADGRLRRAFVAGRLYRSQQQTLARLTRTRGTDAVHLERHDLDPRELAELLGNMRERLVGLSAALEKKTASVVQQVPVGADLASRIVPALQAALRLELSAAIKRR
jgi:hypothetical protein